MPTGSPIRFHWSACAAPGFRTPDGFIDWCRSAERSGVESVHVPIANPLSDALALAVSAATQTTRVRFRIGWGFEGMLASLFGKELKDTWASLGGRLIIHAGLSDGAISSRYAVQAEEFFANCRTLFRDSDSPDFDVEGNTTEAAFLAIKHADCLWRLPDRTGQVYADALPVLHFGKEVGLVSSVIARETREQALEAAGMLLREHAPEHLDDPASWIVPHLWMGTASWCGRIAALVGSFDEVAHVLHEFKKKGISQFLVRGWPAQECIQEMTSFADKILPRIRELERGHEAAG